MHVRFAVIGSRAGAIPAIVHDCENGLLVNPGSSEELLQAIMELIDNPTIRAGLAENAANRVDKMPPEQAWHEWLGVYATVCGETPDGRHGSVLP